MKNILVPIDGSQFSNLAMDKAKEFADVFGSTVTLLYVDDSRQYIFNYNPEVERRYNEMFKKVSKEVIEGGKKRLADLGDRLKFEIKEGNIANTIVDYANENDIDLIIIGPHGKGKIQRFLLGSVANKVATYSNKPVLIVR
ncbi:MAG TPA: universal stress protein [Clostridiales bacterium]|jgi:nucleotide-binding universal stress UspA family protein|nr:universal stress protein [Clostridiales bacterium]